MGEEEMEQEEEQRTEGFSGWLEIAIDKESNVEFD